MPALLAAFFFLFGLIIGSFLNVVVLRLNTGRSLSGRSACLSCGHTLSWHDLVPVFSYLISRGRCRYCGSRYSIQYPLVELLTAVLFMLTALHFLSQGEGAQSFVLLGAHLVVMGLLVVIGAYDMRHTVIPDVPVYLLIAISFGLLLFEGGAFMMPSMLDAAAGPAVAIPLALLWLISRGRWMGLGDAKLALALGWLLGISQALAMLVLSFWIGAVLSLLYMLFVRVVHDVQLFRGASSLTMKSEVAFGPFLIVAYLVTFFFEIPITMLLVSL